MDGYRELIKENTKIEQNAPAAPRASNTATNSTNVTAISGAVFSVDGGKNKELEGPSTMQATEKMVVTFEKFAD